MCLNLSSCFCSWRVIMVIMPFPFLFGLGNKMEINMLKEKPIKKISLKWSSIISCTFLLLVNVLEFCIRLLYSLLHVWIFWVLGHLEFWANDICHKIHFVGGTYQYLNHNYRLCKKAQWERLYIQKDSATISGISN